MLARTTKPIWTVSGYSIPIGQLITVKKIEDGLAQISWQADSYTNPEVANEVPITSFLILLRERSSIND